MKTIQLTQGKVTIVDDEDYECLIQFKWRAAKNVHGQWYAARTDLSTGKPRNLFMHRLLLNVPKGMQTDHINGDGLDNRKNNLRICDNVQNSGNKGKSKSKNGKPASKYKGVWYDNRNDRGSKPWRARLNYRGKIVYECYFTTETEAAKSYDQAAIRYLGEFARLNFPINKIYIV